MSFTDAEELKAKTRAASEKADEFHQTAVKLAELADQIKDLVTSLGFNAPPVGSLVEVAIDDIGAANHLVGQAVDTLENWAKKL